MRELRAPKYLCRKSYLFAVSLSSKIGRNNSKCISTRNSNLLIRSAASILLYNSVRNLITMTMNAFIGTVVSILTSKLSSLKSKLFSDSQLVSLRSTLFEVQSKHRAGNIQCKEEYTLVPNRNLQEQYFYLPFGMPFFQMQWVQRQHLN